MKHDHQLGTRVWNPTVPHPELTYGKHALDEDGCIAIEIPDPDYSAKHRFRGVARRRYYRIIHWTYEIPGLPKMQERRIVQVQNIPFDSSLKAPARMGNIHAPHFKVSEYKYNDALEGWTP
jgi:hypothetical protein